MEIILLQDIPGIGKKNDLLLVGDGYALNCLLPQNKALVATPTVRRRYAEQIKRRAEEKELEKKLKSGAASQIANKEIRFTKKATKTGKLYGAITEEHIAEAAKEQLKIELAPTAFELDEPIKALGTFEIKVKIVDSVYPLKVTVIQEKK